MEFSHIKEVLARYDAHLDTLGVVVNKDGVHWRRCLEHVRLTRC